MGIHRFARRLDVMRSKLVHKQGRKWITAEVKIRKFHNNISDVINTYMTPYLTDHATCNNMVTNSNHFEHANRLAIAKHTTTGYPSKVYTDANATSARSSYHRQQQRPDTAQPQ